ncbi:hypothetical protein Sjap_004022 [Stephania japonica]|uniref:Peptidase A1 domain-containing protein n=1 Tax=Stephania japonica TaxID=461633 RepID=A0AAP0K2D8_9MAGN
MPRRKFEVFDVPTIPAMINRRKRKKERKKFVVVRSLEFQRTKEEEKRNGSGHGDPTRLGQTGFDLNSVLAVYYTGVYGWGYVIGCNDMYEVRVLHQIVGDSALAPHALIATLSFISIFLIEAKANDGLLTFKVDMIHRDSPKSPLYNPLESNLNRLQRYFDYSIARTTTLSNNKLVPTTVVPTGGMFLLNISVGTPPIQTLAIADTGSDLTWTQCTPCPSCYKQELPLFVPHQSSTYKSIYCHANPCVTLGNTACSNNRNICEYNYGYGDGSIVIGNLASETFTFYGGTTTTTTTTTFPRLVFGCGHNDSGTFSDRETGIIGLGGGPVSFISQIGPKIGWKFSYCLVPGNTSLNTMTFGGSISGEGVVTTLLIRAEDETYYFVTLDAISVANKRRIPYNYSAQANNTGNTFIDSGSFFTVLPTGLYNEVESDLREAVALKGVTLGGLKLCYKSESLEGFPDITFHFRGADVVLKPVNYFIRPDGYETLLCLSLLPVNGTTTIIGNRAQINFEIGYDLEANMVSFKPADCTKQ